MLPFLIKSGYMAAKHWLILSRENMKVGCSEPRQRVLAKASCPMTLDRLARLLGWGGADSWRK